MNRKDKIKYLQSVANGKPAYKKRIDLDKCTAPQLNRLLSIKGHVNAGREITQEDEQFVSSLPLKLVLNY